MSWIIRDLWKTLEERRREYLPLLDQGKLDGFTRVNQIAASVGEKHGVFLQVNFPPGRDRGERGEIGHRDLSILVHRERRAFEGITEKELREALGPLKPVAIDASGYGYQGFRVKLASGRIDCLPGGVHLWCEITPEVVRFLDWLFLNAYGLKPS